MRQSLGIMFSFVEIRVDALDLASTRQSTCIFKLVPKESLAGKTANDMKVTSFVALCVFVGAIEPSAALGRQ